MGGKNRVISVSVDEEVLGRFDGWLAAKGVHNRSNGLEQLMREKLDALAMGDENAPAVATVTFIYDHHRRDLMERLAHLQHEHLSEVVSSMHVHLDHDRCLEVLILRGSAHVVRSLGERIVSTRGVERGEVVVNSARPIAGHAHGEHGGQGPIWHVAAHEQEHEHAHERGLPHAHENRLAPPPKLPARKPGRRRPR